MAIEEDVVTLRRAADRLRTTAAAAIAGPWFARHETNDGWPLEHEPRQADDGSSDPADFDGEFGDIALVAGTAAPKDTGRSPGHYQSHHLMAEHDEADLAPAQAQELLDSFRWAALVDPRLAEPLALWLDISAATAQMAGRRTEEVARALSVAAIVNDDQVVSA